MKTNLTLWNTHDWSSRRLKRVTGEMLIQQDCRECGRAFVDECSTGERYAVHVSIFKFYRLSDEVTSRWLSDECPAERRLADHADRQTRYLGESFQFAIIEKWGSDGPYFVSSSNRKVS